MAASVVLGKERVVTAVCSRGCSSSEALKLVGGLCWKSKGDDGTEHRKAFIPVGGMVGAGWLEARKEFVVWGDEQ